MYQVASWVIHVGKSVAYLTVCQLTTGLKDFGGKFYSHNYFDDVGVDSNSGTICMYKGQDVLAL